MERSKAGTKEKKKSRRPKRSELKYNNNNNKHNFFVFYKIWKKYNETQLTKHKMDSLLTVVHEAVHGRVHEAMHGRVREVVHAWCMKQQLAFVRTTNAHVKFWTWQKYRPKIQPRTSSRQLL